MSTLRKVTRDEFFRTLNSQTRDVHPTITNDRYPYTSDWRFHREASRGLFGRSVGRYEGPQVRHDFYLADEA
jgi:hypothetical protein